MRKNKMLKESQNILSDIVGADTANSILNNMFPAPINGYKIGKILTVGELKLLPKDAIIHLHFIDDDGRLRHNDFAKFSGYDGSDEPYTTNGFPILIHGLKDDDLLEKINDDNWTFTVCEAKL